MLGSTLGNNFCMGTQNGSKLHRTFWIFIHTFKLKIWPQQCLRYVCIGNPNVLRPHATWVGVAMRTYKRDDLYPICCNIGGLLALYVSTMLHCSLIPRHHSQLCSAVHWKACFSVCNAANLGIGPDGYEVGLAVPYVTLHDKTKHNALTTDFELRPTLPTTTFELLLLRIWSL